MLQLTTDACSTITRTGLPAPLSNPEPRSLVFNELEVASNELAHHFFIGWAIIMYDVAHCPSQRGSEVRQERMERSRCPTDSIFLSMCSLLQGYIRGYRYRLVWFNQGFMSEFKKRSQVVSAARVQVRSQVSLPTILFACGCNSVHSSAA